jgi:ADP-ribose pyrophosphatase
MNNDELIWQDQRSQFLADYRVFSVEGVQRVATDGQIGDFFVIQSPLWVQVVPLTQVNGQDYFVMVKQFRHGSGRLSIEFPAGLVDSHEELEVAARRELKEETGYSAGKMTLLAGCSPNPALFANTVYTFLAEDLELVSDQNLDTDERVAVLVEPVAHVQDAMGYGLYDHALMVQSLYWFNKYKNITQ